MTIAGVVRSEPLAPTRFPWAARIQGVALISLWAAWVVLGWLGGFRAASVDTLERDLASGSVAQFEVAQSMDTLGRWWDVALPIPGPGDEGGDEGGDDGGLILYRTTSGALRAVSAENATAGSVDPQRREPASPASRSLVKQLVGAGAEHTSLERYAGVARAARAAGLAVVVVWIVGVVGGPAPRWATRWFWFWMGLMTLGVGIVLFAAIEGLGLRPHSDPPPERRHRGILGLPVAVLAGFAISFAANIVAGVLAGSVPL